MLLVLAEHSYTHVTFRLENIHECTRLAKQGHTCAFRLETQFKIDQARKTYEY